MTLLFSIAIAIVLFLAGIAEMASALHLPLAAAGFGIAASAMLLYTTWHVIDTYRLISSRLSVANAPATAGLREPTRAKFCKANSSV